MYNKYFIALSYNILTFSAGDRKLRKGKRNDKIIGVFL